MIHERFGLIEHLVQRLQYGAVRAYSSRANNFHVIIREALSRFERSLADVLAFPINASPPAYVSMAPSWPDRQQVADRFMADWEALVGQTETKFTRL